MKQTVEIDLPGCDEFIGIVRAQPTTANYFIDLIDKSGKATETFMLYTGEWNDLVQKMRDKNKMYRDLFDKFNRDEN